MAEHEELLRRFQPHLRYDSNEAFFADSAAEWTDNPSNELRRPSREGRPGEVLAAATPKAGQEQLSLEFLSHPRYANGIEAGPDDVIGSTRRNYREMYVAIRQRPGYANRMYGRAKEDSDGRLWLQYWFFYFYNDYNLAGGFGLHEGDWEMVQFRMGDERPDVAVYAQHDSAEKGTWDEVEKPPDSPTTPVVYVSRGSHASYFSAGYHETEAWYDIADGKRPAPQLALEILDQGEHGWPAWQGRWGDTRPRIPGLETSSPRAPCAHDQWDDPKKLLEEARRHVPKTPPPSPEVTVERRGGRLVLAFDFSSRVGPPVERLVITVNSVDDRLPPRTHTFAVFGAVRGSIETDLPLEPTKRYDVYVSTADVEGRPSESRLILVDPVPGEVPAWRRLLPRIGIAVGWIRRLFGRR